MFQILSHRKTQKFKGFRGRTFSETYFCKVLWSDAQAV